MNKIRKAMVAGYFYPSNPEKLSDEIETLLSISNRGITLQNLTGIISPHAGYIYSGRTAAFAYNLLNNKTIDTVIIISPSHREYFPGICIYDGDGYETPLGIVKINCELADNIVGDRRIIYKGIEGHREEHAIEVQIPFLQKVLTEFKIVPIVMGDQGKPFIEELANRITQVADEKTLIVASSDLSHYYSKQEADKLDSEIENDINEFNIEKLQNDLDHKNAEACGGGPIIAMMKAASLMNKKNAKVLNRSNSGDTTGDYSGVVGYLSAAVY
ncbi:MAG: AmmeMemoRadiSam system protein B [Ignavibacteriaceae bacterium]